MCADRLRHLELKLSPPLLVHSLRRSELVNALPSVPQDADSSEEDNGVNPRRAEGGGAASGYFGGQNRSHRKLGLHIAHDGRVDLCPGRRSRWLLMTTPASAAASSVESKAVVATIPIDW